MKIEVGGSCINNKHKATSLSKANYVGSLCSIRKCNLNKLVVALHNINSLRIKFSGLVEKIKGNVSIHKISETKLDNSFPDGHN